MGPKAATGELRLIGGCWRRRRLRFPPVDGLRPTPDRVRETLFNWLLPEIEGSRCLDLFAGSGALGFEALSRGARAVVLVEREARAVAALRENAALLGAAAAVIRHDEALTYLRNGAGQDGPFGGVFLDPPFGQPRLLSQCLEKLMVADWLPPGAWVYSERRAGEDLEAPPGWIPHRESRAGQVRYALMRKSG